MIKILIVEDNDLSYSVLSKFMSIKTNYRVERAINGIEAVSLCKRYAYDFIFMDYLMPLMNGVTATKEIRRFDSKVPIVFQTALRSVKYVRAALRSKATDYVVKPINSTDIHEMIDKYLKA